MNVNGKPEGRQGKYKDENPDKLPDPILDKKKSSRLEMSIINMAHGEEPSNYDHKSIADDEEQNQLGDQNMNEDDDINVKFRKRKDHGLQFPLHPQQVGTWVVMTILVLTFYLFLVPGIYYISAGVAVFIGLVYFALLVGVTIFCLRATLTDPTDRNVLYERQCREEGIEAEENDELEFF